MIPRTPGEIRYAVARDAAWTALSSCAIVETIVGSRAWGLADETSDTDVRGVFALPFRWTIGLADPPLDLASPDGTTTYWEFGKAIEQGLRADPNTLEMLFLPSARAVDEIGGWLLEARDAFVSREIYGSFGRYAISQIKRLDQSLRLARSRGALLDWLREREDPTLDEAAQHLAHVAEVEGPTTEDRQLRAKQYVKEVYRSLFDRGVLPAREFTAFVAFAKAGGEAPALPRELRPKNAYNLVRLLVTATRWLREGSPTFAFDGALREELFSIKRGEVPLERVLARAGELSSDLEAARHETVLPESADVGRADVLLRRAREELAKRALGTIGGPFASDAPSLSARGGRR